MQNEAFVLLLNPHARHISNPIIRLAQFLSRMRIRSRNNRAASIPPRTHPGRRILKHHAIPWRKSQSSRAS